MWCRVSVPLTRGMFAGGTVGLIVFTAAAPASSHQPIRVEEIERREDFSQGIAHERRQVTFLAGDRKRVDILERTKLGASGPVEEVHRIEIVRLDKGVIWKFNKTDGTQSEHRIGGAKGRLSEGGQAPQMWISELSNFLERTGDRAEINGQASDRYDLNLAFDEGRTSQLMLVGEVWSARDVPEVGELLAFEERMAQVRVPESNQGRRLSAPFEVADAMLQGVRQRLMRANGYPSLVQITVYRLKAMAGTRERVGSIHRETKGIYPAIVFCTCNDQEKLFEFWGGFISLQIPLFQQPF